MLRFLLSTTLLSTSAALAATVSAQTEARQDTIIVTAPGPERSADELIGNASSIEREEILETLAGSLGDTLDREPGVASTFFGQGASRPVLRGLGAERVQVLTNGIGVIDASAASPDHQVSTDGIDAEKIEILRGPAALAYGGQAIGGVVNVIDGLIAETRPDRALSTDLFGAYNSVNSGSELAGRVQAASGPIVVTLSASQRDFDDYDIPGFAESSLLRALEEAEHGLEADHEEEEESRGSVENAFVETTTYSAGVSWVGESAFLGIAARQQAAEYGLPGHGHGHSEGDGEAAEEEETPFIDLEQTRLDLRGGVTFTDSFLTDIVASAAIVDYDHTEFEAPGEAGTVYESEGVESRIEFGHRIGGLEGAFGLQYLDKDLNAFGEEAFLSPTATTSFGVFLYETRDWDNGLGIEGGLRVETIELDNVNAGQVDFDLASGSFGIHRHFSSGWFVGTQVSYTERAPNESELFAFGPHLATEQFEVGDATLGKETGINFEGVARWTGDATSFGINLFVTEFDNFTFLTPGTVLIDGGLVDEEDGLPVFLFTQDGASFIGGELYASHEIDDGPLGAEWVLGASLDLVEADLDGGSNVPFLPPVTFNATASAEWGPWEAGAAITLAGDQDDPGAGQLPTDGYAALDLRGEVDLSDFGVGADGTELFVEVRNVTDEEIRFATSVLKDLVPAPGRNIRVGLRLAF